MNSVKSNNLSLTYQRFTTSGSKDIEVEIFDFVPLNSFDLLNINISTLLYFQNEETERNSSWLVQGAPLPPSQSKPWVS